MNETLSQNAKLPHGQSRSGLPQKLRFQVLEATFAGVWLFMLAFPIASTLASDASALVKISFICLNVVFAVVYFFGFGYREALMRAGRPDLVGWWITSCIALILVTVFFIGPYTLAYSPWVVALLSFSLPQRWGIPLSIVISLSAVVLTWVFFTEAWQRFTFSAISGGSAIIIIAIALATRAADNHEQLMKNLAVSKERENIARDVHDLLGHSLTVMNLKAELARELIDKDPAAAKHELQEISGLSRVALAEIRSTVTRLHRPDFAGELQAADRALLTAGITSQLPDPQQAQLTVGNNAHLFSCVLREVITNVVRHSQAQHCRVELTPEKLQINDDGVGWDGELGNGLIGLHKRVQEAGGTLLIESTVDAGAQILLSMSGDVSPVISRTSSQSTTRAGRNDDQDHSYSDS